MSHLKTTIGIPLRRMVRVPSKISNHFDMWSHRCTTVYNVRLVQTQSAFNQFGGTRWGVDSSTSNQIVNLQVDGPFYFNTSAQVINRVRVGSQSTDWSFGGCVAFLGSVQFGLMISSSVRVSGNGSAGQISVTHPSSTSRWHQMASLLDLPPINALFILVLIKFGRS